ncbi:MAG: hypothetical protein LBP40_04895 [Campylobacteraceae bacterium]|nr:hypothetical protein [Campylobacteraceae bacterium]
MREWTKEERKFAGADRRYVQSFINDIVDARGQTSCQCQNFYRRQAKSTEHIDEVGNMKTPKMF